MTAPFLDGTMRVWLDSRVPFERRLLVKTQKITMHDNKERRSDPQVRKPQQAPSTYFAKRYPTVLWGLV